MEVLEGDQPCFFKDNLIFNHVDTTLYAGLLAAPRLTPDHARELWGSLHHSELGQDLDTANSTEGLLDSFRVKGEGSALLNAKKVGGVHAAGFGKFAAELAAIGF